MLPLPGFSSHPAVAPSRGDGFPHFRPEEQPGLLLAGDSETHANHLLWLVNPWLPQAVDCFHVETTTLERMVEVLCY